MALAGDPVALRLRLDRIIPSPQRPTGGELPAITSPHDAADIAAALAKAVPAGYLTPNEVAEVASVVRRFERRVVALLASALV